MSDIGICCGVFHLRVSRTTFPFIANWISWTNGGKRETQDSHLGRQAACLTIPMAGLPVSLDLSRLALLALFPFILSFFSIWTGSKNSSREGGKGTDPGDFEIRRASHLCRDPRHLLGPSWLVLVHFTRRWAPCRKLATFPASFPAGLTHLGEFLTPPAASIAAGQLHL